jgi:hypothetical protein
MSAPRRKRRRSVPVYAIRRAVANLMVATHSGDDRLLEVAREVVGKMLDMKRGDDNRVSFVAHADTKYLQIPLFYAEEL